MREDIETIRQIRDGAVQAYADLVRKYQTRIRGYCLGILGNTEDADDAAQEIFIKAYKGLKNFRQEAEFSTWLTRIAINHCRDILKKPARGKTESWDALEPSQRDSLEAGTESPRDNQCLWVREAFSQLPAHYRTILFLREVDGLSYQELAGLLNCSTDAVKARLRRARLELETKFKERV